MKTRFKILLTAAAVTAALALWLMWPNPEIAPITAPAVPPAGIDLQQGARVVALGDCMVCHTANGGRAYAGGLPLKTPFGTIYTTNITPDPETGIGRWSYPAFERALRHGVSRDGHLLYPAFPYIHYTRMTDDDIHAAYDYLMSRAPVQAPAPPNQLIFPLGFRPMLAGWNLLFLHPGNRITAADQRGVVLRGRYLVDSLAHCASCHSGLNPIGGETSPAFAGGRVDGWDAPALNHLQALTVPWSAADLFDYLRCGVARAHGAAAGPMQPVVAHLSEVPDQDVHAIVAYLRQMQPDHTLAPDAQPARGVMGAAPSAAVVAKVAMEGAAPASIDLRRQGATLFAAACAACHSDSAPMTQVTGSPALKLSRAITDQSPNNFLRTVLTGVTLEKEPARIYMPPFADILTDAQVTSIAAYVRADIAGQVEWQGVAGAAAKIRKGE